MQVVEILAAPLVAAKLTGGKIPYKEAQNIIRAKRAR
jgi:hypothetical protein